MFLHAQKFGDGGLEFRDGRYVPAGPAQPRLSFNGRTLASTLRQVRDWHGRLAKRAGRAATLWQPCGIAGLDAVEGTPPKQRRVRVIELTASPDLVAEGRAMRHCVASYAGSCVAGRSAIFSLRVAEGGGGEERRMTVEVLPRDRRIVQARGRFNAAATPTDLTRLRGWAATAGLTISRHLG